ncbi:MAG: S8 family serine peptidase [Ignisphaera sp.]
MEMEMKKKFAIAYNTEEQFDRIKSYYNIYKEYKEFNLILVKDTNLSEITKVLDIDSSNNDDGKEGDDRLNEEARGGRGVVGEGGEGEKGKRRKMKVATLTKYTIAYERAGDFNLHIDFSSSSNNNAYVPAALTYIDVHRLSNFSYAVDEITKQTTMPPCGDSNVIFIFDTGLNITHEAFAKDFMMHLSDNFTNFKAQGLVERYSVVGDDGSDDFKTHGHGTPVTFLARMSAPNADIFSIKVIRKVQTESGGIAWQATDEEILDGLRLAFQILENRKRRHSMGVPYLVELYNMSFGGEPSPTPTPVELAIENISKSRPQAVFLAAAGNLGPGKGTIVTPAQSPWCIAIGSCESSFFASSYSSRGPARNNLIKPEYLFFGTDIVAASRQSDTAYASFTGTSFATPLITGALATTVSGAIFVTPQVQQFIRQIQDYALDIRSIINYIGTKITVKPRFASDANLSGKDNTYGWGIPMGDRVAQQMNFLIQTMEQQTASSQLSQLSTILQQLLMLGMLSAAFTRLAPH